MTLMQRESIQSWNFQLYLINPTVPNLFMKKSGPGVPIISASPPCLTLWLDQHSAENSRASIPHRAEQPIGRRTKRDDGHSNRSPQEARRITVKRETPPFCLVE